MLLGAFLQAGCGREGASTSEGREVASRGATTDDARAAEIDRLRALGYIDFAEDPVDEGDIGVVAFDRERSMPGYNIYTIRNLNRTDIIDAEGEIVHSWHVPEPGYWARSVLLPDGDLMVVGSRPNQVRQYLMRLAWDGSVRWRRELPVHHDVTPTLGGGFTTLSFATRQIDAVATDALTRDDRIVLVADDGAEIEAHSLYDMIAASPSVFPLQKVAVSRVHDRPIVDLFHANSVFWMGRVGLSDRDPLYAKRSILVSIRHQDRVAIFDLDRREAVWAWGEGELMGPHDATILPGGTLLVFDNGLGRGWSRVLELDPRTGQVVWAYQADPPEAFYTASRGACQRLANGNTLITESDRGRAFEVTPEGETVWEFRNPYLGRKRGRATIVRLYRLDPQVVEALLAAAG